MLISVLCWAEKLLGAQRVAGPFPVHQGPGGPSIQRHYRNEADVLSLSWPVTHGVHILGAMAQGQPRASEHIPGSNPAFMGELWSRDSGNVSGWLGTAPRARGGGEPIPRTTALTASPALTSALFRDIPDFKRPETSPCPEDTAFRIRLRSTWGGCVTSQHSSGMRRAKC